MFRLILEESTQVTKSSIFLWLISTALDKTCDGYLPCNEICSVCDDIGADSHMALLNESNRGLDVICHA